VTKAAKLAESVIILPPSVTSTDYKLTGEFASTAIPAMQGEEQNLENLEQMHIPNSTAIFLRS